ncbi:MAG: phosphoribosylformylglycinamidine synthase II, partial [Planctomycetota bacterium]
HIGRAVLANETIENLLINSEELSFGKPTTSGHRGKADVALLDASDEQLEGISQRGELSLSLEEMREIQAHYAAKQREPTACELETLAQTWSEHCKHKTFAGRVHFTGADGKVDEYENLLKETVGAATTELARPFCVSVFVDNAGIVTFEGDMNVAIKVETHNHPSAIDPYGGAGTGIGGVIRDILGVGLGARPIANTDCFFVGPQDLPADECPKGTLHPKRILKGVVAGVRDYGNRMGIPTVNGGVWFDEAYTSNPLVYAGTVGLIPNKFAFKKNNPGDLIVSVGGRTGRDGIHGATFSSAELTEDSETLSASAVQIGDPITEKRVLDCLLAARDRGLYGGLTDCGAGGYSSAVGEMAEECGAEVELDKVPLKYPGLASHEIWISEAQERMVMAVPPQHEAELTELFEAEGVEVSVIGKFTDTGKLLIKDRGEEVAELDMKFLHDGCPRPVRTAVWNPEVLPDPGCPRPDDFGEALTDLLSMPNIASKEWIIRQYDHEVQGMSVIKPLVGEESDGPGDAAVLQPLPESRRGLVISCGANPRYGLIDPYAMALSAIDEAMRNAVAVGGDPDFTAILDNFSWGNCEKSDRLGSLVLAAKACYDGAMAYGTPFISGKDSLNNEYRVDGVSKPIPPTLLITALSQMPDIAHAQTMDAKTAGNALFLVGETKSELGGSHYHVLNGLEGGRVPQPVLATAPNWLRVLFRAHRSGLVSACHDLSEGGLAVAVAEMGFAGNRGIEVDLAKLEVVGDQPADSDTDALLLFSESATRLLVEVTPECEADFRTVLDGVPLTAIGKITDSNRLVVRGVQGETLIDLPNQTLRAAHAGNGGNA